jgi:hypothetical protein
MTGFAVRRGIALVFALGSAAATGAEENKTPVLPEVTVVPEIDFARHPPLGAPAISPDGQHIAVSVHNTENGENRYQLAVLHLPDLKYVSRLDMNAHYVPVNITWVDNKRLVMSTGEETAFSEAPASTGDVIAVDMDGKNKRVLYSDRMRDSISAQRNILKIPVGFGVISGLPDERNGHFYLTVYPAAEGGGSEGQAHKTLLYDIDAARTATSSSCTRASCAMPTARTTISRIICSTAMVRTGHGPSCQPVRSASAWSRAH